MPPQDSVKDLGEVGMGTAAADGPVVCLIPQTRSVMQPLAESLSRALGGRIRVVAQHIDDFLSAPLDADCYVVPSGRVGRAVQARCPGAKVIVAEVVLDATRLPELLKIAPGTSCLVVAGSRETSEDTVRLLAEYGFCWLALIPYWPGCVHEGTSEKVAITPGSPELCPGWVTQVIDIGPRVVSLSTLTRLCLTLGLGAEAICEVVRAQVAEIAGLGKTYLQALQDSERHRAFLSTLLDSMEEAIAAIDAAERVVISNRAFRRLADEAAELGDLLLRKPEQGLVAESINGDLFIREILPVRVPECQELVGRFVILRPKQKVTEAERALRRALYGRAHAALYTFDDIIGDSPQIRQAIQIARKFAASDLPVLITGETGTGKELFAHAIHNASPRAREPFVCVNFAAMPSTLIDSELFGYEEGAFTGARKGGHPGLFEQAHKGTIFLDEIGDAPLECQAHLLRVLEDKRVMRIGGRGPIPVDVRVIAATNQDIEALAREGRFRRDLLYRLKALPLHLPSLRSRAQDIPLLARHFLAMAAPTRLRFSEEALGILGKYDWPGNVRQLESVVKYLALICPSDEIRPEDLPSEVRELRVENEVVHLDGLASSALEIIACLRRKGRPVGRRSLRVELKRRGYDVSDHRMRILVKELARSGFISVGRTSQGVTLTEKGQRTLGLLGDKATM
ncbi:MAG: sigma 54-interacting transcriptional regulator [Bacillota bacterium]